MTTRSMTPLCYPRATSASPPGSNRRLHVQVVTLDEYLDVALGADRPVGIYPETKFPAFHDALPFMKGDTISQIVLDALEARGYRGPYGSPAWRKQPCFIQSFEARTVSR
jgi:glycerophosphoryl diester phosphodiesterase